MSRAMTRWTMAGALALGALGTIGGFAPGVATAEAAPQVSPFAGSWSGTWAVFEVEVVGTGTFDWTISDAGRITGRVYGSASGNDDDGTVVGHVGANGKLVMIGYAPADVPTSGSGVPFQGTAVIDGDGKLVVSVTRTDNKERSLVAILARD